MYSNRIFGCDPLRVVISGNREITCIVWFIITAPLTSMIHGQNMPGRVFLQYDEAGILSSGGNLFQGVVNMSLIQQEHHPAMEFIGSDKP